MQHPEPNPPATRALNRRGFLGASAAAGLTLGLAGAPAPARVVGANESLRIGIIGSGGRARELIRASTLIPEFRFVHLCDVWTHALEETAKAAPDARTSRDHRALLDDAEVDAVLIATPDHWHVAMLRDALDAGKHVYIEKPLTHSLEEGPVAIQAVKDHPKLVVEVGQQQRSMPHMVKCYEEVVEPGKLGKVFHARIWWNYWAYPNARGNYDLDAADLDWKTWLGPAPDVPFDPERFRRWRSFWEYGGGHTADLATHLVDVVHWFLGVDHPRSAVSAGGRYFSQDGRNTPDTIHTLWEYESDLVVTWEGNQSNGDGGAGIELHGTDGTLYIDRQMYEFRPKIGKPTVYRDGLLPRGWFVTRPDQDAELLKDWLGAIRDARPPRVPIEVGVHAAGTSHLGNVAFREGRKATWPEG